TNFLGIPGDFQHPRFIAAVDRIIAACEAAGKAAAFIATDETWGREYASRGFRLFAYGLDQLMLQTALKHGLDLLREAERGGATR
ncbi:MAG TPA: aldolase, partial [Casimicrobiaceae bacterium]